MLKLVAVFKKEIKTFLCSPVALVFFGAYLLATLFSFFWVEKFFSRNLADVRPLFEWMPVIMIFLASAITMRMWSEERRTGTIELLMTSSAEIWELVLGKFFACLVIIGLALAFTMILPFTVNFVAELDWGPVVGGYVATLFLAAGYLAVGLYVSSRSESQIESLILSSLICGFFYILGTDAVASFFGAELKDIFKFLAPQVHFESIMRGVVDFRDIFYYFSFAGVFLCLNVFRVDRVRGVIENWTQLHFVLIMVLANLCVGNLWLAYLSGLRVDLTKDNIYSVSDVTKDYIQQATEPLLIRGYFSSETHPLLSPLVPRIRDILEEYKVAGGRQLTIEFIDPANHPELEREANERYGIKPIPFQFASKYQSSVVNSYFNILVSYVDEHEILDFRDLISVKAESETDIRIDLRNPEYDVTQAIKKVLKNYASKSSLFENIQEQVKLKAYVSPEDVLPESIVPLRVNLDSLLKKMSGENKGKFSYQYFDPEADNGKVRLEIEEEFGFQPMTTSYFSTSHFWFYLVLESGGKKVQIDLPEDLTPSSLEKNINEAIKKLGTGFMKTVGIASSISERSGLIGSSGISALRTKLLESYLVEDLTLSDSTVPANIDLMIVISPKNLDEKSLFAIDQFLMRGGTIVIASSPFDIATGDAITVQESQTGLENWLLANGITVEKALVLDKKNMPFPVPVDRNIGGFVIQETQLVDYPYFIDIRDERNSKAGVFSGLEQVTLSWGSPIKLEEDPKGDKKIEKILESSSESWVSTSLDLQPDYDNYGDFGFEIPDEMKKSLLGVSIEGSFESYFKDRSNPFEDGVSEESEDSTGEDQAEVVFKKILKSPENAKIMFFSSNTFVSDVMLDLASSAMGTRYETPANLIYNAVDWSLEDVGLLAIRGRGQFIRTLPSLSTRGKIFLEYFNYFSAFMLLIFSWYLLRIAVGKRGRIISEELTSKSVKERSI